MPRYIQTAMEHATPARVVAFLSSPTFEIIRYVVRGSQGPVRDVSMVPAQCGCAFRERCNPELNHTVAQVRTEGRSRRKSSKRVQGGEAWR